MNRNNAMVAAAFLIAIGASPAKTPADETSQTFKQLAVAACPGDVWVGIIKSDGQNRDQYTCKKPIQGGPWSGKRLFPDAGDDDLPSLQKYCVYTTNGGNGKRELKQDWPEWHENLSQLDKDCAAVAPAALDAHQQWLLDEFDREAGQPSSPPGASGSGNRIRLAFLDGGPTNPIDPWNDYAYKPNGPPDPMCGSSPCSPHGFLLVNMARRALCWTGKCGAFQITSQLAMPRVNTGGSLVIRPAGGVAGYFTDVVQAIDREVHAWESDKVSDKLILNLSLGWEPAFGGSVTVSGTGDHELSASTPATVRAVHSALANAACKGALIIAAAGNFPGPLNYGSSTPKLDPGPTVPGAWEALPRPVNKLCEKPASPYAPLLYAVGGVDGDDRPIANSRPLSRPRLVAFANHAVATFTPPSGSGSSGEATRELTGTSVAAGVVSVAAAVKWNASGGTAAQVMAQLHKDAPAVSRSPVGCTPGTPPTPPPPTLPSETAIADAAYLVPRTVDQTTRRIYISPGKPPCGTTPVKGADIPTGAWPRRGPTRLLTASMTERGTDTACHNEAFWNVASEPGACAHWAEPGIGATPWGGPQPGDNPCMGCSGKPGSGVVFIELDRNFLVEGARPTISDVTLVVGPDVTDVDGDGNPVTGSENARRYSLMTLSPLLDFADNNTATVCVDLRPGDQALLSMKLTSATEERSVTAPILILPHDATEAEFAAASYCGP